MIENSELPPEEKFLIHSGPPAGRRTWENAQRRCAKHLIKIGDEFADLIAKVDPILRAFYRGRTRVDCL